MMLLNNSTPICDHCMSLPKIHIPKSLMCAKTDLESDKASRLPYLHDYPTFTTTLPSRLPYLHDYPTFNS